MNKRDLEMVLDQIEFLDKATNLYETKNYVVRLEISVEIINGVTAVYGHDRYASLTYFCGW